MTVIYKYLLEKAETTLSLPAGATVLCTAEQSDDIHLWIEQSIEPHIPKGHRTFLLYHTGNPIDSPTYARKYIGTVHTTRFGVPFVIHVFEKLM